MALSGVPSDVPGPVVVDSSLLPAIRVTMVDDGSGNQLTESLITGLLDALERAQRTAGAEVLVLDAVGQSFCSGLSMSDMDIERWRDRIESIHELFTRLSESPLTTIAVVNGAAVGGGVGLGLACDLVLAGGEATFRLTEVRFGLIPVLVLPLLARRIGAHRAVSLATTARPLSGAYARELGLVDDDAEDPVPRLRELLVSLRATDHAAVRALKRYGSELGGSALPTKERALELLAERIADPATTHRISALREQGLAP